MNQPSSGSLGPVPRNAELEVTGRFRVRRNGTSAIRAQLQPNSLLDRATVDGRSGANSALPDRTSRPLDQSPNPQPRAGGAPPDSLIAGDAVEITFHYRLDLLDFAGGLHWYPVPIGPVVQEHTARFEVLHRKNDGFITHGRARQHRETGQRRSSPPGWWSVRAQWSASTSHPALTSPASSPRHQSR